MPERGFFYLSLRKIVLFQSVIRTFLNSLDFSIFARNLFSCEIMSKVLKR